MVKPKRYLAIGNRPKHRVRIEKLLLQYGVVLEPDQVVHHKDGNKRNNRIENLTVMSYADHRKLHAGTEGQPDAMEYVPVVCPDCGKERKIQYRTTKRPNYTGLCTACNSKRNYRRQ